MKQLIAVALILALALTLGCATKQPIKPGVPSAPVQAANVPATTADVTAVDTSLKDVDSLDDSMDPELDSLDEGLKLDI